MSDLFKVTKTGDKVITLHLEGNLDAQTENELVNMARNEFDSGTRFLLIDLRGVEVVSSAGLRALHVIYKIYTPENSSADWNRSSFRLASPRSTAASSSAGTGSGAKREGAAGNCIRCAARSSITFLV